MDRRASGPVLPMNLELVTVTETSAILTWYTANPTKPDGLGRFSPVDADTELLLGTSPANLKTVLHSTKQTPYHYAEISGLEPGQTYFVVAKSNGIPAIAAPFNQGLPLGTSVVNLQAGTPLVFQTPQPPPGKHLFSIALCNDLHIGETVAGLITSSFGGLPPGFSQVKGKPPYAELMAKAMVADAKARGADLILAAGDLTSEASGKDLRNARSILDGFGTFGEDYLVARGNHDRAHEVNKDNKSCNPVKGAADHHDCFKDTFFPASRPTWFSHDAFGLRILGLDTYDKLGSGGDNGVLSPAQFDFVRKTLRKDPDMPTIVFGHHPVNLEASITTAEPLIFDLDVKQGQELQKEYARTPGVFLHHAGHTHRNKRSTSTVSPHVQFQEVAATKEYPGGFHLLRVHTGGYAMNFYKTRSDLAREWSERTRQEDFGAVPLYVFGNTGDRNCVVERDFSDLKPARR